MRINLNLAHQNAPIIKNNNAPFFFLLYLQINIFIYNEQIIVNNYLKIK